VFFLFFFLFSSFRFKGVAGIFHFFHPAFLFLHWTSPRLSSFFFCLFFSLEDDTARFSSIGSVFLLFFLLEKMA